MEESKNQSLILATFAQTINTELEIRFKGVNKALFYDCLARAIEKCPDKDTIAIEKSCNLISRFPDAQKQGQSTYFIRRTQLGANNVFEDRSYYTKTQLVRPTNYNEGGISYALHLSKEEAVAQKFREELNALVRLKYRIAVPLNENWRADFTCARQSNMQSINSKDQVQEMIAAFFPMHKNMRGADAAAEYIEAKYIKADSYEIELEFVGKKNSSNLSLIRPGDVARIIIGDVASASVEDGLYAAEVKTIYMTVLTNGIRDVKRDVPIKQVFNKVNPLNKATYKMIYPPYHYYITDKADGVRAFVVYRNKKLRIISDRYEMVPSNDKMDPGSVILDCELIRHENGQIDLYAFDVILFKDKVLAIQKTSVRIELLREVTNSLATVLPPNVKLEAKKFMHVEMDHLKSIVHEMFKSEGKPYVVDGLILTPEDTTYANTRHFKWKPSEYNSVDFWVLKLEEPLKARICKETKGPKGRDHVYIAMCTMDQRTQDHYGMRMPPYYEEVVGQANLAKVKREMSSSYPYPFYSAVRGAGETTPTHLFWSDRGDLSGFIVELLWVNGHWNFQRVRHDRVPFGGFFGNHYLKSEVMFINQIDPMKIEDLYNPQFGYFSKAAEDMYKDANHARRMHIEEIFKTYMKGANIAMDLAAGRGGDLNRYYRAGIKRLINIDIDSSAIIELLQRRSEDHLRLKGIEVNALVQDLREPYNKTVAKLEVFDCEPKFADAIVCNFAMHYFCENEAALNNVLALIAHYLRDGGIFIMTAFDGKAVYDLIEKNGGEWRVYEGEFTKYHLKGQWKPKTPLADCGQKISVKLPMSDGLYDEPLLNYEFFKLAAAKWGLKEVSFEHMKPTSNLSEIDAHYTGLYFAAVFSKGRLASLVPLINPRASDFVLA